MKVIHRISVPSEKEYLDSLNSLGITSETSDTLPFAIFEIEETHPKWLVVEQYAKAWRAVHSVRAEFTADEFNSAQRFQVVPNWHWSYPQPENGFQYINETYDLKDYCKACGLGKTQKAPFRLKGEPKWGKQHILQLNWVYDEYFVPPDTWKTVFSPLGIGATSVLRHREGSKLKSIVQLIIPKATAFSLQTEGCAHDVCSYCRRLKYLPITGRFFPQFIQDPDLPICKTEENFGSGASAFNAVIVSRVVYESFLIHRLKGASFIPAPARAPFD